MDIVKLYPSKESESIYVFELVGTYFTDVFFNHIYINAKLKLGKNESLIDEYIRKIKLYVMGIRNDKDCYGKTINNLYKYIINITKKHYSYIEFIDHVSKAIVSKKFISKLTYDDKCALVENIICDLVSNLSIYTTSPNSIKLIVLEHKENSTSTIQNIQDWCIQILMNKKINILNNFLKEIGEIDDKPQDRQYIEYKNKVKNLSIEKIESEKKIDSMAEKLIDMATINESLKKQLSEYVDREGKLRKLIKLISEKNNSNKKTKYIPIFDYEEIGVESKEPVVETLSKEPVLEEPVLVDQISLEPVVDKKVVVDERSVVVSLVERPILEKKVSVETPLEQPLVEGESSVDPIVEYPSMINKVKITNFIKDSGYSANYDSDLDNVNDSE